MTTTYIKHYATPARCQAARAHLEWLTTLESGVRLPTLLDAGPQHLAFEHLGHTHPGPHDLVALADALGRLHAAAHTHDLHAAHLDRPFRTPTGLVIPDFITPRRAALQRVPLPDFAHYPTALYKDANIRNFLITPNGVAILDFDDLTLAPYGYDLAKLIVSTAMTHGTLPSPLTDDAFATYNQRITKCGSALTGCTAEELHSYAELHHVMTAPYLNHNGYIHPWPAVRPWLTSSPSARSTG